MSTTAKEAFSEQAKAILQPYKMRCDQEMQKAFDQFGPENQVKEAMIYALMGEGKRFRPALVYMVADALKNSCNVTPAALSVEYFHTASLVADDLPSMDNDDYRRGRLTTHKVYGENVALLASYALIAAGFEQIAKNDVKDAAISRQAVLLASKTMGALGLIGGQCYDLFPGVLDRAEIIKIMDMKTGALFDLSFSLGWLFGGGNPDKLDRLHKAAYHFGIIFQVLDDLDDQEKDAASKRAVNYANQFGVKEAVELVQREVAHFLAILEELGIAQSPLSQLAKGLHQLSKAF